MWFYLPCLSLHLNHLELSELIVHDLGINRSANGKLNMNANILDLIPSSEAGKILGVTSRTIRKWVSKGTLPGYRSGSRLVLVPKVAVLAQLRDAKQN